MDTSPSPSSGPTDKSMVLHRTHVPAFKTNPFVFLE
jgi:hypothetical protein